MCGAVNTQLAVFCGVISVLKPVLRLKGEIQMANAAPPRKEVKRRFQLWIKPSTLEQVDKLREEDNCESRSEFIEKAVLFYSGFLSTKDNTNYLPNIVISTLRGIIAENNNKMNRMLFKLAVEIAIMQNLIASSHDIDALSMQRLRGECVKEVKRLNGAFQFEDALEWQKDE